MFLAFRPLYGFVLLEISAINPKLNSSSRIPVYYCRLIQAGYSEVTCGLKMIIPKLGI